MCKFLLFAGTTEGRTLYERLSARGVEMDISVATEYGKELIEPLGGRIYSGRMTEEEMEGRIRAGGYGAVVDATHPYADIVTQNIRKACQETETLYIRLLRKESRSFGQRAKSAAWISGPGFRQGVAFAGGHPCVPGSWLFGQKYYLYAGPFLPGVEYGHVAPI